MDMMRWNRIRREGKNVFVEDYYVNFVILLRSMRMNVWGSELIFRGISGELFKEVFSWISIMIFQEVHFKFVTKYQKQSLSNGHWHFLFSKILYLHLNLIYFSYLKQHQKKIHLHTNPSYQSIFMSFSFNSIPHAVPLKISSKITSIDHWHNIWHTYISLQLGHSGIQKNP